MVRVPLLATVQRALRGLGVPSRDETLLVGLSGGPDSVALLDILAAASQAGGYRIVAAHLDHALRPDSAEDASFCAELCRRLGVSLRTSRVDVRDRARREGGGLEQAARLERYAFFRTLMREEGASFVAVAHTRDDQAETLLLRLLRGAASAGLAAMRPRSGDVLRPLLAASRAQVLAHLEARGLPYRVDPTNADLGIPRNRVRHELIPYLESRFNPRLREALARTAGLLADDAEILGGLGGDIVARGARHDGEGLLLPLHALRSAPRAAARAALRHAIDSVGGLRGVAAIHVERLLTLAHSPSPSGRSLALPGGREAQFRFDELWIGPRPRSAEGYALDLPVPGCVALPGGVSLIASPASSPGPLESIVGAPGPLVVRTRRPGDRIRAHGRAMSLKRYLMERRVPAAERDRIAVVASGGRVVWVAGQPAERPVAGEPLVRLELVPTSRVEATVLDAEQMLPAGTQTDQDMPSLDTAVERPRDCALPRAPLSQPEPSVAFEDHQAMPLMERPQVCRPLREPRSQPEPSVAFEDHQAMPLMERPQVAHPSGPRGIHSREVGTSMTCATEDAEPRRVWGNVP